MRNLFLGAWFILASVPAWGQLPKSVPEKPTWFFKFQLDVFEERGTRVGLADSRTVEIPEGKTRGVFIGNFTLDLTAKGQSPGGGNASFRNTRKVALDFGLTTLAPTMTTKNGSVVLDTNRVLTVPEIEGKGGSSYRLVLRWVGTERKEPSCSFEELEWKDDISARYYFWFVPNTWGDFHWNLLRDRVEDRTDSLGKIFNLVTSQKLEYYFAPCLLSDWVWDGRFYFSLEPARRRAISSYCREANSFDPWVPNLLLFYLTWGQAPAPLAEGAAAYFDYPHFWARQYLRKKELDSISQFITTYKYRQLPAEKALMEAGSFVRFLVEKYDKGLFESLYRSATELSVKEELSKRYGKPLDSLETEWRNFLLSFKPDPEPLRHTAREEFWNYRFEDALNLYRAALELDSNPQPYDYEDMALQFYNLGGYDSALVYYLKAYRQDSTLWQRPYVVANFYLLLDDTGRAGSYYQKVLELDSSIADGIVRQASYFFEAGRFDAAESLYQFALKKEIRADDLAELNLNSGYVAWRLRGDFRKGNERLNAAWDFYRKARGNAPGTPLPYWRLGELFLYKNMPDSAEANLKFAVFLETRPYYLAKLFIRLGNLHDVLNRRKEALDYYRQVQKLPAARLDRRRAQAYLKKPFQMPAN